jgi:transposase
VPFARLLPCVEGGNDLVGAGAGRGGRPHYEQVPLAVFARFTALPVLASQAVDIRIISIKAVIGRLWLRQSKFRIFGPAPKNVGNLPFEGSRSYPCESCRLYNMALSTVGGFIKRKRETGSVSPDKFGGYKTFSLEPHTALVKELVAKQPDSTLAELQVRLAKENMNVSQSAISRFLHHINLTFKKKTYTRRNKIGPTLPRPVRRCGKNS